ncbi:MAG: NUDIX hydrolase [Opitutales bacterium]|jgi:8-oxo-dGTP diphosphatase|nr:NUDIX hydrolase [Opitutales bacterium]MDP4643599.1 NUDIX hydrolase [Opitutales bacterium]MDP4879437.1 NUDIX hydrolase [Opitutales bacterium]MDP4884612.1 NUDIX hydrolase [Opitutales bacterium]MDP5080585.1 NUDIX hydrolase [Opitutales bacterium]
MASPLPYKISALVFVQNTAGEHLLIQRRKAPNKGCWSPIGGKLDMSTGESPYECARREIAEEIGLTTTDQDLHCFGYIAEKSYEGAGHWLMFLFDCTKRIEKLPTTIDEGHFAFYSRTAIDTLAIPETDKSLVWPYYDQFHKGFIGLRADCATDGQLQIIEELKL